VTPSFRPFCLRHLRAWLLVAALAAVAPAVVRAAPADDEPPELAEKTSDSLNKLQPLLDAKNWDGALALLNGVLPSTDPDSYDRALILDTIAKLSIQKDDTASAVAAWEQALALADRHSNYFKPKDRLDMVLSMAQNYSQLGSNTKDPVRAHEYFNKAGNYIKRWLDTTPKPTLETEYFYTEVLYSEATETSKVDMTLIRQAQREAEKALRLDLHPPEKLYVLLNATYQQQLDFIHSSQILELLAAEHPEKVPSYWPTLWQTYMNLASTTDEKDPDKVRIDYIRGINALERAQSYGQMKTNKDNYNLFTMYYTVGQFGKATEILHKGLESGTIDSTLDNWLHLAGSYRFASDNPDSIAVLKEAEARYPDSGELDFQLAQIYWQDEKMADAFQYFSEAVRKGNLSNAYNGYRYMASVAYDLQKFPEALAAADKAAEFPEGKNSAELARLRKAVAQGLKLQQQEQALHATATGADAPAAPATPAPTN
jgi:tetratricopeptide (TPR) repeat protein